MDSIGKKLTELRKRKGISQEELATDLKISQSTISNYEIDATSPTIDILQKICDYFQIPITNLFSDEKFVFHTENNNGGNIGFINSTLNTFSEKIFELYETRIKEKDELIDYLKTENQNLKEQQKK
jgi:transcriptional regulator with XRE-family HTH domain